MKNIKLILFFFLSLYTAYSIEMKLKIDRIDVDFDGVVNSPKTVLCYGSGSSILRTYDNGRTWEQENIFHDSIDIKKMLFVNEMFIGILDKEFVLTGDINGRNWKSFFTGIENQQSLASVNSLFFILSNNVIHIYNENFNPVKSIEIKDTNVFSEIAVFNDKLLAGGTNGILALFDIHDNYKENVIDFKNFVFCTNCPGVRKFSIRDKKAYLSFGADIYESDDLNKWDLKGKSITLYDIKDDQIYDIRTYGTSGLPSSYVETWLTDSLKNKKISNDWQQRNVDILAFTDFRFVDSNIGFAVGRNKLIAKTIDRGVNWELISNFKAYYAGRFNFLNDSVYYSVQPNGRIYRTLNSGITWLPPLITNEQMTRFKTPRYFEFAENGYGFLISDALDNENDLMQTYDFGNSYTLSKIDKLSGYFGVQNPSFIKTEEGYNVIVPRGIAKVPLTTLIKLDTGLKFVSWKNIYDSVRITTVKKTRDKEYLGFAVDLHWPYYFEGDERENNYWFLKSTDNGETWEKQFEIFMGDTSLVSIINKYNRKMLIGGSYHYKDMRDTPNINQLFIIDMDTGQRTRIFNDIVSSYGQITEYKDYLIFGGWECLFVNSNYKVDLLHWEKLPVCGKYIRSVDYLYNKLFLFVYDIDSRQDNLYLSTLDFTSHIDTQIETKTYLYSYPPYPIPASNIVHAEIFWDMRFDFDEADIGIYSYTGARIADRDAVVIDKTNNYSGKLSWNCTGYESGVYFIIIKHGDARRVIPVVVGV